MWKIEKTQIVSCCFCIGLWNIISFYRYFWRILCQEFGWELEALYSFWLQRKRPFLYVIRSGKRQHILSSNRHSGILYVLVIALQQWLQEFNNNSLALTTGSIISTNTHNNSIRESLFLRWCPFFCMFLLLFFSSNSPTNSNNVYLKS